MRAFEDGKYEFAELEKRRLENTQRERRKISGGEAPPKYFTKHIINEKKGMIHFEYGSPRNYWEDRKYKDWSHLT